MVNFLKSHALLFSAGLIVELRPILSVYPYIPIIELRVWEQCCYLVGMNYFSIPGMDTNRGSNTAERILALVSMRLGIKPTDIRKKCRLTDLVDARMIIIYLIRSHTRMTLKEIGLFLGGRDHTTIIHSITRMNALISCNDNIKETLHLIESKL